MKKIFCSFTLLALIVLQWPATSTACGDKFLVKGKCVSKAQCYMSAARGNILIYRNPGVDATEKALGKDLERALSNAGNNVRIVDSRQEFESAVKSDVFDVILAGYSAVDDVEKTLRESGKEAKIVPVVNKEDVTQMGSAKARYGNIIKDDDRTSTKVLIVSVVLLEGKPKVKTST